MKKNTRRWLRGLIEAAIQAASTSIAVLFVEPHMVSGETWWKLPAIAGAAAFMAIVRKLQAEPLPPEEAPRVRKPRGLGMLPVLLVLSLGLAGCASRNVAPQLVASEAAVHEALASAHDRIEAICKPGVLVQTCQKLNPTIASALRAGRAFSAMVLSERLGGLGALVEQIGKAIAAVGELPQSDTRDRVMADLRRALDGAFQGVQ